MKLTGLGSTLNRLIINGVKRDIFSQYSNHIWLPQTDHDDGAHIDVCYNCKSVMKDGNFIPYSEVKPVEKKIKKKVQEKK